MKLKDGPQLLSRAIPSRGGEHVQRNENGFVAFSREIHRMLDRIVRVMLVMVRFPAGAVRVKMVWGGFHPRCGMMNMPLGREMDCNEVDVEGEQSGDEQARPTSREEQALIQG